MVKMKAVVAFSFSFLTPAGRAFSFLRTPDFDVFAFSFLRTPDVCESSPLPLQAIPRLFSAMQKVSSSDSYSCSLYSSSAFSYGE